MDMRDKIKNFEVPITKKVEGDFRTCKAVETMSAEQFYEIASADFREDHAAGRSSESAPSSGDWDKNVGYDKAKKLFIDGDKETSDRVRKAFLDLKAQGDFVDKEEFFMTDEPAEMFDVGAFCSGDPEYYVKSEKVESEVGNQQEIIKIYVDITSHCGVTSEQFYRRGAIALVLCESLELSGYSTEIHAVEGNYKSDSKNFLLDITIKESHQYYNADKIAYILSHPAFYRRLYFRYIEQRADASSYTNNGYGRAYTFPKELLPKNAIKIDKDSFAGDPIEYIKDTLEKYNIKAEGIKI